MSELQHLYRVQQLELQLEQLQKTLKNLPVYAQFKQLQAAHADAKETLGWAETKLTEHSKRVRRLEADLQQTEAEQQTVQHDLYADAGHSAKELEKLDDRAKSLQHEHEQQEETLLLAMEGKEDLEKALAQAQSSYTNLHKELVTLQKTGNEEIHHLKDEITKLQRERDELLLQISEPFISEYRKRRNQYHGRPLAQIAGDICSGCRVGISSMTKRNLQIAKAAVYCENCGRLLVPAD